MDNKNNIKNIYEKYASEFNNKIATLSNYNSSYDFLLNYINDNDKILDLACGPANISKYLKEKNKTIDITGIDFSENILKIARKNIPDANFIKQDIKKLVLIDNYNIIIFGFGLPYLDLNEIKKLLNKVYQYLTKKKCIFYISFMEGNKSCFEKTSFSKNDLLYVSYHKKEIILKILEENNFILVKEFILDYFENNGNITKDIIYILTK